MSFFYLGVYWPAVRPLTLRQYADLTRSFLQLLEGIHPAFRSLEWVGDRPNSAIDLSSNLCNLDELIYQHARFDETIYQNTNPDGTPSWQSVGYLGYSMDFGTGKSARAGGVSIGIKAGGYDIPTPNAIRIAVPLPGDTTFPHREFYDYDFLKGLFTKMITFWKPANGLVTMPPFSEAVVEDALPYVGWLTYLKDPRAAALRNCDALRGLTFEEMPGGGTLISLDKTIISPTNFAQVEKARCLRRMLVAERIVT